MFWLKKCVTTVCASEAAAARDFFARSLALRLPSLLALCDELTARRGQIVPRAHGDAFELVEVDQRPVHSHDAAQLGLQLLASQNLELFAVSGSEAKPSVVSGPEASPKRTRRRP